MISPKATRPSVTSSIRWYSNCGLERAARRRTRWTSATNLDLLGERGEGLAALRVVAELVEAGACRREQHHVPGAGAGGGGRHGGVEAPVAPVRHAGGGQRPGDVVGGLAVEVDRDDRPAGHR